MSKTEVMKVCEKAPPMRITVKGDPISSLKYLVSRVNAEALCDEEIKTRVALARERMGKLDLYERKSGSFRLWYGPMSHTALRLGSCPRI